MHSDGTKSGRLFGYFVPDNLEVVIPNDQEIPEEAQKFIDQGARAVTTAQVAVEPRRGCGRRSPGGVYMMRAMDQEDLIKLANMADLDKDVFVQGKALVLFPDPGPLANAPSFRGFGFIDGDELIGDLQAGEYKGSVNHYYVVEGGEMTLGLFVNQLAKDTGVPYAQLYRAIKDFTSKIGQVLLEGDSIRFPGLGIFETVRRGPRAFRNPRTGESVDRPSRIVVKFRACASLKQQMVDAKEPKGISQEMEEETMNADISV